MELKNLTDSNNLVSSEDAEVDKSEFKIAILGISGFFFSFLFSYLLNLFIESGNWDMIIYSVIAGLFFAASALLGVFFIKSRFIANLLIALQGVALLLGFYNRFSGIIFAAAFVAASFMIAGNLAGEAEIRNLIRVKFWRVSYQALPRIFIGLAVFISLAFYVNVRDHIINKTTYFFISKPAFETLIKPFEFLTQGIIPEFKASITMGEFIDKRAEALINGDSQFKNLTASVKKEAKTQAVSLVEKQISDILGKPVDKNEKISDAIYDFLFLNLINMPDKMQRAVPAVAAIAVFFAVWSIGWFLRPIVTVLSLSVYEILLALGVVVILRENTTREIVVFKTKEY